MNCATSKELFSEYIDDALDSDTKAQLEEHVLQCAGCRRDLEELRALVGEIRTVEPVKTPDDFLAKLHERIEHRFSLGKMIRTLFVPMRIKIPVQFVTATATAVLVFSIINLDRPEKQLNDAPMISEKKEVKPEQAKERTEPLLERKTYAPKPAAPKILGRRTKTKKAKGMALKRRKSEKTIKLALILKTDTHAKPALKRTALKSAPVIESSEVHDEQEKATARYFLKPRIAGKASVKEEVAAGAAKTGKKAETPLPEQPSDLREDTGEPKLDVEKTTKKLRKIIKDLNGEIKSVQYDSKTEYPISLNATIPADKYPVLYGELKEMGVLHGPAPTINEKKREMIKIRLVISK